MAPHSSAVKLPSGAAPPPGMGAHQWSHAIAKGPPRKIRIVHVVEPTVIKTDPRQFRELVQRLTGKPPNGVSGVGGWASSSSSSADSASADSSSRAASGSSSDRAVVAPASAVKAEMKEEEMVASPEEEMASSPEEEAFARAFEEVLGKTNHGATMATVKVEEEEGEDAASPEEEGFARAFGEVDKTYEAFFHGLDDFLLSAYQADGFSL